MLDQHSTQVAGDLALKVTNLTVKYRVGRVTHTAVSNVSFAVQTGSIVALVGESGSGKSTLAHSLVGLLARNGRLDTGSVELGGTDIAGLTEREMQAIRGRKVGFVPQDPMMSLNPTMVIGRQVAEALSLHLDMTRAEQSKRVIELLEQVGLPRPEQLVNCYPHELSGGMCQRVLIAMAFACSPEIIIADEPTSALDASVSKRIMDRLETLVRESGVTLLIITHDLAVARRRADQVFVMSKGEIVETGPTVRVFDTPGHAYTRRLLENSLQLRPRKPRVEAETGRSSDVIVSVRGLTKNYRLDLGGKPAVDGISFDVERGTTFALVGESGSGKSTAVRMILGLETITAGKATVLGNDIGAMSRPDIRNLYRKVQIIYQSPYGSLDPRFSVEEIVAEPLRSFGVGDRKARRARVTALLDRVELPATVLRRRPSDLSGGQRQRVAIARALAVAPELIICDEPVSALDATVQAQVLDLLNEIQRESGVTYLFISHDLSVVADISHRVAVMQAGKLIEVDTPDRIFSNPREDYTRALLDAAFGPRGPMGQIA